jgi:hypothetical protein
MLQVFPVFLAVAGIPAFVCVPAVADVQVVAWHTCCYWLSICCQQAFCKRFFHLFSSATGVSNHQMSGVAVAVIPAIVGLPVVVGSMLCCWHPCC